MVEARPRGTYNKANLWSYLVSLQSRSPSLPSLSHDRGEERDSPVVRAARWQAGGCLGERGLAGWQAVGCLVGRGLTGCRLTD